MTRRDLAGSGGIPAGIWWRGAAFLAIALILAFGLLAAIWLLARPLALLLAAIVVAQALEPAVAWLEGRLGRPGAVAAIYLLLALLVGLAGLIVVPTLVSQIDDVMANAPALIERAQARLDAWSPAFGRGARQALESAAGGQAEALIELPLAILAGAVGAMLVLIMAIYWSLASPDLRRFSFSFIPPRRREQASEIAREVVATMGGYVRARALSAVVVAVISYIGLLLIGVRYPVTLALLAGFGEFIPFVGPAAGAVAAAGIALLASPIHALVALAFFAVLQQIKGYVVMPILTRQQAKIPPLVVVVALVAGGSVGGIVGALVATPLVGALRVVFLRLVAPAVRRWLGMPDGEVMSDG